MTAAHRYRPGPLVALVGPDWAALLPAGVAHEAAERLEHALDASPSGRLMALVGHDLGRLPEVFALVERPAAAPGSLRVVVRGAAQVTITRPERDEVHAGAGALTWRDVLVPAGERALLRETVAADAETHGSVAHAPGPVLPTSVGAVLVTELDVAVSALVSRENRATAVTREPVKREPVRAPVSAQPEPEQEREPEPEPEPEREVGRAAERAAATQPSRATRARHAAPEPEPEPEPEFDHDVDDTVLTPAGAARLGRLAPAPPAPTAPTVPAPHAAAPRELAPHVGGALDVDQDHDGDTILKSDLPALRRELPAIPGSMPVGPVSVAGLVTPAPRTVVLHTGERIALNRPVLVGRAPSVSRVGHAGLPRLVTVASPLQDISRNHLEIRQDDSVVLVTDLGSTNGVQLTAPGQRPRRLAPGIPTPLSDGHQVDLGEGVVIRLEPAGS